MNCRSTFKTLILCQKSLILCQLSDNRGFQSYSQLSFPSLVDPPNSELYYSPLYLGPPHYEKCGSVTFSIFFFRWVRQLLQFITVAFRTIRILLNLRADILVAFKATEYLEDAMLPANS